MNMRLAQSQITLIIGLILAVIAGGSQASERSVKVMMPWDGEGTIYTIGTDTLLFMGAFEGIMYVEKEQGELDAAFAKCPASQQIKIKDKSTKASGYCQITISPKDSVFAEWSCTGKVGSCTGTFKLTGGTGKFEGITGTSDLVVRSVLSTLVGGMGDGSVVRAASGIAVLPKLTYKLAK
jgi:hypothetical protein